MSEYSEFFQRTTAAAGPGWTVGDTEGAVAVLEAPDIGVTTQFQKLAAQWMEETSSSSILAKRLAHPAYQRIVGMGKPVISILLDELSERPNWWFHALRSITGVDPVLAEDRGNLDRMAAAWIAWGRSNGYT